MIRLQIELGLKYEVAAPGCDFIFNLHAAKTQCQIVRDEQFVFNQQLSPEMFFEAATGNRYARLRTDAGLLTVNYKATVDITHFRANPATISEVPVSQLPMSVLNYIYPSRYCQSDRLAKFAIHEFGNLWQGYSRVQAIQNWVLKHVTFTSNTTTSSTSAVDTMIERVGVCRDFAHLMIAICRALSIPARFVTGTDFGADPSLGPPDFHAYVEVFLGGRWYLFDPSGTAIPMGLVRFGTGRDAADVAFATIFGTVKSFAPQIFAQAITDDKLGIIMPVRCDDALSTDGEVH